MVKKNFLIKILGKLHDTGIENVLIAGDQIITSGSKGAIKQYSLEEEYGGMKHAVDYDDMRRRSTLINSGQVTTTRVENVVRTSNFANNSGTKIIESEPRKSSLKRSTAESVRRSISPVRDTTQRQSQYYDKEVRRSSREPEIIRSDINVRRSSRDHVKDSDIHGRTSTTYYGQPTITTNTYERKSVVNPHVEYKESKIVNPYVEYQESRTSHVRDTTPTHVHSKDCGHMHAERSSKVLNETIWTEDYVKNDVMKAINTVLFKFGDADSRFNKMDVVEGMTMKLRTKCKKIKLQTNRLADVETKLNMLVHRLGTVDSLDTKTDRLSQKLDSMSIHLSRVDGKDNTVEERMALFSDDVILRLGRINTGHDYTDVLNSHIERLDNVNHKCHEIEDKVNGLGNLYLKCDAVEARLIGIDNLDKSISDLRLRIDAIDN